MIPLQDVVPTRQTPIATLALIALTVVYFLTQGVGSPDSLLVAPFAHSGLVTLLVGIVLLWLFGDNVEARLGRAASAAMYLLAGWVPGLGASGAVTAVLGAYFVLLPRSRVLTLVPAPGLLVELPAAFFLALWLVAHMLQVIDSPPTAWKLGIVFLFGAALARLLRRPVKW